MTDKITEIIGNISLDDFNLFDDKTNSKLEYNRDTFSISRDFSWIPIVEESLPYLDNIIRNPKKFLQQEEDIVIVEKSKKISTETIEHLAQHTNYIQNVDKQGMIQPSKVLNINKEDTWDLYENRFIFSLVKELVKFIEKYADKNLKEPITEINRKVKYNSTASFNNEEVRISLDMESIKQEKPKDFNMEEMKKKIIDIRDIILGFDNSSFIKSLSQAIPVKSPIRKTNIILKDTNFQKALALWEYIKNSEIEDPEDKSEFSENLSSNEMKKKFDLTYFLNYAIMNNDNNKEEASTMLLADKILSLIEQYIDTTDVTEKKIMEFVNSEIKIAVKKRKNKEKEIVNIYNRFIKNHNNYLKNICNNI